MCNSIVTFCRGVTARPATREITSEGSGGAIEVAGNKAGVEERREKLASFDAPGVAAAEEFGQVAGTAFGLYVANLLVDYVFVAREIVPGA